MLNAADQRCDVVTGALRERSITLGQLGRWVTAVFGHPRAGR